MGVAVLLSGGLDSAVLLADEVSRAGGGIVQPIYVSAGLAWEPAERDMVARLLAAPPLAGRTRPLAALTVDMRDVYAASHWAVTGQPPAYHTPDEDVYLPGRNIVLLGKAGIFAAMTKLDRVVMGTLDHNPFPDATPDFRAAMARALSSGLAHELQLDAPYAAKSKAEVIRLGQNLGVPFHLTLSCMSPDVQPGANGERRVALHCGTCSKCRERHDAFVEAGLTDPTAYVDERFVRA
jgi:7-cyano-7-deazaguanine synthase